MLATARRAVEIAMLDSPDTPHRPALRRKLSAGAITRLQALSQKSLEQARNPYPRYTIYQGTRSKTQRLRAVPPTMRQRKCLKTTPIKVVKRRLSPTLDAAIKVVKRDLSPTDVKRRLFSLAARRLRVPMLAAAWSRGGA